MSLADRHVVVLVTGISAAGTSTVSDLLARRFTRGVHVKGDIYRRMVVAGRVTSSPKDEAWRQLRLRYRLGASTADAYFNAGFSVVVQDIVIGPILQEYVDMIDSRPLCVVVLAPEAEVVGVREAGRPKTAYRNGIDGIRDLDEEFRADTPRIGLWLDTSQQTAAETVEAILDQAWDHARIA